MNAGAIDGLGEPVADDPAPDEDPWSLLQTLLLRCARVPELAMRVGLVRDVLSESSASTAVFILDHLIRGALTGDDRAESGWTGTVLYLLSAPDDAVVYARLSRWYEVARAEQRDHVGAVLLDVPAHRTVKNARALQQPRLCRDVSLGARRQMASGADRALLERLMEDLSPLVVQKLCDNPRMELARILGVATRRPNLAGALAILARSPRWICRYEMRLALVNNPYTPTGASLKMLPLLHGPDLRRVAQAGDLHPALATTAGRLLDLRSTHNLRP